MKNEFRYDIPKLVLTVHRKQKELEALLLGTSIKDDDLVSRTLGKPHLSNTISYAWTKSVCRLDIKPNCLHYARHTHTNLMLKQGIHPKIVQERLDHSRIQIILDSNSHIASGLQEATARRFGYAFQIDDNEKVAEKH